MNRRLEAERGRKLSLGRIPLEQLSLAGPQPQRLRRLLDVCGADAERRRKIDTGAACALLPAQTRAEPIGPVACSNATVELELVHGAQRCETLCPGLHALRLPGHARAAREQQQQHGAEAKLQ